MRADHGLVLVNTIVVRGDVAAADVGVFPDDRIARVAEVGQLGAVTDLDVLCFVERADLAVFAEHGVFAEVAERPNGRAGADAGFGCVGALDGCVLPDVGVAQSRVWADHRALPHRGAANELNVRQQGHVLGQSDIDIDPRGFRILDRHTFAHPLFGDAAVEFTPEGRELDAVVRAFNLPLIGGHGRGDAVAVFTHDAEHVGQVHLALCVIGRYAGKRGTQFVRRERVDAGVDLVDESLFVGRVLVFDDARDVAVLITHDASVTCWVVDRCGQDGRRVAFGFVALNEFGQKLRGQQRNVAVGYEHGAFVEVVHRFKANLDGAAGAWDLVLVDDAHVRCVV